MWAGVRAHAPMCGPADRGAARSTASQPAGAPTFSVGRRLEQDWDGVGTPFQDRQGVRGIRRRQRRRDHDGASLVASGSCAMGSHFHGISTARTLMPVNQTGLSRSTASARRLKAVRHPPSAHGVPA